MWCGGGGGGRRGIWGLGGVSGCRGFVSGDGVWAGGWVERWRRTLGVELENVDVAVRVRDGDVELFVRREECCCYHFDCVGRFAEEAELVGILLCPI